MRFPGSNQTGLQTPVNFQVDVGTAPGWTVQTPQVVAYVSKSPRISTSDAVYFPVNTLTNAIALDPDTQYFWQYNIHWRGFVLEGPYMRPRDTWTPLSEVWLFRTATNAGQLPPAPVEVPPSGLPSTQAPPMGNPNVNQAGLFSSLLPGGNMSTQNWIILAVVAVAVWFFFIRK